MTPPAATITPSRQAGGRTRRPAPAGRHRTTMPRGARRVSGPAGGVHGMRAPRGAVAAGATTITAPMGLRLARRAAQVQDAPFLDRLIRGRLWIGLIGVMLIGLVFLQLSLLSLNAGIGEALQRATVLERQNATLATQVSTMAAGERVQDVAADRGMVMPAAGDVQYLKAGRVPPAVAARGIAAPSAAALARRDGQPAPGTTPDATATATTALAATTTAPAATTTAPAATTTAPAATTTPVTTPVATPPAAAPVPSGTAPPVAAATAATTTPQG